MIRGDMREKRRLALQKVWNAIEEHNGTTLLSTGITGDDARMAMAAVAAGARLLEPNHPAVVLARGLYGARSMGEAETVRYKLPLEEMLKVISGVRNAVGPDVIITAGVPGGFPEERPVVLRDEDFIAISQAGADSLHIHKNSLDDIRAIVEKAHTYGLLVDTYIEVPNPEDKSPDRTSADTPEDVARIAKELEDMGVDMIGLMTGMTYQGVEAGEISPVVKERVAALVETVKSAPTLAEGGINLDNYAAFKGTGVHILVVGTSFDNMASEAVAKAVKQYLTP